MTPGRIEELFSNKTLTEMLALFMTHPDHEFYQRQIAAELGRPRSPVQMNLKRLEKLNIVTSRVDGNRIAYRANRFSPIFDELRRIILKTVGFGSLLKEGIKELSGNVKVAFIYGSTAKGTDEIDSDVDLIIIGELTLREASSALAGVREKLNREINVSVYPPEEFGQKLSAGEHFVSSLMGEEKIFLIGDDEELGRLCK